MHRPVCLRQLNASLVLLACFQACAAVDGTETESDPNDVPEVAATSAALANDGTCSPEMWDAVVRANQGANWLIDNALDNFSTPENQQLRVTWFGNGDNAPDAGRDILFRMLDMRLYTNGTSELSIRCEPQDNDMCFPGSYAYHLPNEQIIHLCPVYFTYDHNQGDFDHQGVSQVGGLLHELSHLTGTSDTFGYYYGYDGCKELASFSSVDAIDNADNWRYYLMQVP